MLRRPSLVATVALVFIVAAFAPSCAADPSPVTACVPGAQVACACAGLGAVGAQVCAGDGSRLGPCVCPMVDAGDDAAAVDGAQVDALDAGAVDALDAAEGGRLDGPVTDAADAADAAAPDAGPVVYDLNAPPAIRWRFIGRLSSGADCDVMGTTATGYACTATAWRVDVSCESSSFTLAGTNDRGTWSVVVTEPGGATSAPAPATIRAGGLVSLSLHTSFAVPAGATRGVTGVAGRTTDPARADVWLFGCM